MKINGKYNVLGDFLILSVPGLLLAWFRGCCNPKLWVVSFAAFVVFSAGFSFIALPPADAETCLHYTVKQDDCLWLIARRHSVTVEALTGINGLKSDLITPGQVLDIPGKNVIPALPPVSTSASIKYKVVRGDCLWLIARRYGVPVAAVKGTNGLSSDLLHPGQVLIIPRGTGTEIPAANPRITPALSSPVPSRAGDVVQELLSYARSLLGTPYRWAGESPATGFDCSGFTKRVFERFGIHLPHSAVAQNSSGVAVGRGEIAPGDILLFRTSGPGIDHAVIYCGLVHSCQFAGWMRAYGFAHGAFLGHPLC